MGSRRHARWQGVDAMPSRKGHRRHNSVGIVDDGADEGGLQKRRITASHKGRPQSRLLKPSKPGEQAGGRTCIRQLIAHHRDMGNGRNGLIRRDDKQDRIDDMAQDAGSSLEKRFRSAGEHGLWLAHPGRRPPARIMPPMAMRAQSGNGCRESSRDYGTARQSRRDESRNDFTAPRGAAAIQGNRPGPSRHHRLSSACPSVG